MKVVRILLVPLLMLLAGCEKDLPDLFPDSDLELTDGFCLVAGDQVLLNHHDIDRYDYGAHIIYLKDHRRLSEILDQPGTLTVYAGGEEIYTITRQPGYSSTAPEGPFIWTDPTFYGDHIISIQQIFPFQIHTGELDDAREDPRIVEALKNYGQYREGLQCGILSIEFNSPEEVVLTLELNNRDSENYYYLDPGKMGLGLYHYFTNGLYLMDVNSNDTYTHQTVYMQPDPWDSWDLDWMSLLEGHGSAEITLTYTNFEAVPGGSYWADFRFPGLANQVEQNELVQEDGYVWLGHLSLYKEVLVE
jgi:hypothetical protein